MLKIVRKVGWWFCEIIDSKECIVETVAVTILNVDTKC